MSKFTLKKDHNCLLINRHQSRIYNLLFFYRLHTTLAVCAALFNQIFDEFSHLCLEIGTLLQFLRKIYSFCRRVQPAPALAFFAVYVYSVQDHTADRSRGMEIQNIAGPTASSQQIPLGERARLVPSSHLLPLSIFISQNHLSHLYKINFNIILTSTSRSPK